MLQHLMAFILFFTSHYTVLINYLCAMDITPRVLNTCSSVLELSVPFNNCLRLQAKALNAMGQIINDVTQIWTFSDPPPPLSH